MSLPNSDSSNPPLVPSADPFEMPLADPYDLTELTRAPLAPDYDTAPIVMPVHPFAVQIDGDTPVVEPVNVECWRCGWYDVPDYGRCARCDARLNRRRRPRPRSPGTGGPSRLGVVLISYGLLVLTCMVWGLILVANARNLTEEQTRTGMVVMEVIDTILVLATALVVGRVTLQDAPPGSAMAAWALAGPVLFALIAGNMLFSAVLREVFRIPTVSGPPVTLALILIICVQPAVVEELFFRYVAFGALRREMSLSMTILVTSIMFAVAHLHNPLGMPYLFVAGVVFGYARVYGGLSLSMLLHFLHNLAVISIDSMN